MYWSNELSPVSMDLCSPESCILNMKGGQIFVRSCLPSEPILPLVCVIAVQTYTEDQHPDQDKRHLLNKQKASAGTTKRHWQWHSANSCTQLLLFFHAPCSGLWLMNDTQHCRNNLGNVAAPYTLAQTDILTFELLL